MALPANRVPVRVARGLKSALVANLGDLLEGELLYAKDEDKLYMVEGGALVAMGADLAASSVGDLSDVTLTSASVGEVLRYNGSAWVDAKLDYSDLSGTPTLATVATTGAYSDLSGAPTLVTSLDGLSDVSYTGGSLKPTGLDEIVFSSADVPGTDTWKVYANSVYGMAVGAYLTSDSSNSSYMYAHPTKGVELKTTAQIVRLTGPTAGTNNTPELRWESANPTQNSPNGNYFGLKLPAGYSVDQTYTLPAVDGTTGQVLKTDGNGVLSFGDASTVGSIDDLSDVDTTTVAPTSGQVLEWNGTNWVPATVSGGGGGVTSIIAGTGISVDQATGDVTITATGGGGGVSGIGIATRVSDSGTAASGALTLTGLGSSGMLHTLSTDLDAWVVFYGSAADRTADAGRAYNTDPAAGSGVLAEAYVTTAGAILFTPGTGYMNNDTTETAALYLAVRDQAGAAVNATLTVTAYAQGGYDGISGGTFGSG